MTYQVIEFYEFPRIRSVEAPLPHKYSFRPIGKPGRKAKQRRAFDYLEKSGALRQATQLVEEPVRHRIVPSDFMDKLYQQQSYLFRKFNLEGRTLLIGSETYAEMMGGPRMQQVQSFDATYYTQDRFGTKVCDLTVQVIPWMRGLLVMP